MNGAKGEKHIIVFHFTSTKKEKLSEIQLLAHLTHKLQISYFKFKISLSKNN
jgi:hypothetical protein